MLGDGVPVEHLVRRVPASAVALPAVGTWHTEARFSLDLVLIRELTLNRLGCGSGSGLDWRE